MLITVAVLRLCESNFLSIIPEYDVEISNRECGRLNLEVLLKIDFDYVVQEETEEKEEHIYNRLSEKMPPAADSDKRDRTSSPLTASYPGGRVGGVSQTRGGARVVGTRSLSSSQVGGV